MLIRGLPYLAITAFPSCFQVHPELQSILNKSILLVIKSVLLVTFIGFYGLAGAVTGIAKILFVVLLLVVLVSLLSRRRAQCKTGQCSG